MILQKILTSVFLSSEPLRSTEGRAAVSVCGRDGRHPPQPELYMALPPSSVRNTLILGRCGGTQLPFEYSGGGAGGLGVHGQTRLCSGILSQKLERKTKKIKALGLVSAACSGFLGP